MENSSNVSCVKHIISLPMQHSRIASDNDSATFLCYVLKMPIRKDSSFLHLNKTNTPTTSKIMLLQSAL